jgi:hypothetical protein
MENKTGRRFNCIPKGGSFDQVIILVESRNFYKVKLGETFNFRVIHNRMPLPKLRSNT